MKKVLAFLLAALMLTSLVSCSSGNSSSRELDPLVSDSGGKSDEKTPDIGDSAQPGSTDKHFEPLPRGTKCNTVGMSKGETLCVTADGGVITSRGNFYLPVPEDMKVKAVEVGYTEYFLMEDGSVYNRNWEPVSLWTGMEMVELSSYQFDCFGLRSDGAVVFTNGNVLVEGEDIVSFDVGEAGVLACVKADGTMLLRDLAGGEYHGAFADAANWTDIVQVVENDKVLAGLKSDGTVVMIYDEADYTSRGGSGSNPELATAQEWTDIVSIEMNNRYGIVGVHSDGTVTAAGEFEGEMSGISTDTKEWTDIVAVQLETYFITGIKADGSLIQIGTYSEMEDGQKIGSELECDNAMMPW